MMRIRLRIGGLAVAALALGACAGDDANPTHGSASGDGSGTMAAPTDRPDRVRPDDDQRGVPSDSLGRPAPLRPDASLTPGDALAVGTQDICMPGYGRKVRNVPAEVKRAVYVSYGVPAHDPGEYEVDHLVSLGIGGSNSVRNLWPESNWTRPWNARAKDALEDKLHREVCAGRVDLHTAQHDMASDWITAYQKYLGRPVPR